jgi:SRSO17 transposase
MQRIGPHFARVEPRLQARKYIDALTSDLVKRNGWSIAEHVGDRRPERCQRLLNHAVWDTVAGMGAIRRFTVEGLDRAARGKGLRIGALDETGQEKKGRATAGVKGQHLGCAGGVDNGINTVHLSYGREKTGRALIGARQWIPAEQITDPATAQTMGLPADLVFRTKGQLAIDILTDASAEGMVLDFVCGDEV